MHDSLVLLHLSLLAGIGPGIVEKIMNLIPESSDSTFLYRLSVADLIKVGITESIAHILVSGLSDTRILEEELARIEKYNISWCSILDPEYPEPLKQTYLPPLVLFWQGARAWLVETPDSFCSAPMIACVGARIGNKYGQRVVEKLVPELVEKGWVIVSGGAHGIDAFAHEATVSCGGKTIVVLGSGLLQPYPEQNIPLFEKVIASGGTVMSCFPSTFGVLPGNFPARNRIVSGLSRGCIVVQAARKSGALITAQYALEQGRSVFAVPGPIDDPLSEGCHELITDGAVLVTGIESIMEEFGIVAERKPIPAPEKKPRRASKKTQKKDMPDTQAQLAIMQPEEPQEKDPLLLFCATPRTLEELAEMTGKSDFELTMLLFDLQISGKIDQNFAGLWYATRRR